MFGQNRPLAQGRIDSLGVGDHEDLCEARVEVASTLDMAEGYGLFPLWAMLFECVRVRG